MDMDMERLNGWNRKKPTGESPGWHEVILHQYFSE